jgi:DNA-binding Lrp family transcriptional regulator
MESFLRFFADVLLMKMKREKLIGLLFELVKNSKRSDRELAKILGISQPTVTRLRKTLEKEAIDQYTLIPNLVYLGFDIVSFTCVSSRTDIQPMWEGGRKWAEQQPNVVFVSTGQGMGADAIMVSVHKDYADFSKFYQNFRRDWGKHIREFNIFLISLKGSTILKHFSFNYLIDAYSKET